LADCRIHNGEMFKAERSIHTSVQHFYDLTEKDEYFLSDLCYALSSMAVIQKNTGDCEQALATVDEIISYMEHNNNHLKNTNLKLYFSVLICQLQCLIDTEQYQQGVGSANTLINAITDSRYKESKLLAEALLMHSDILIGLNKTPDALDIALQATQHYRFLLENNPDLLSYKIDLAHSLSRVCFLQSSDQPQQALATIKEVLNIYAKTPHLITDELLAEKAKALAYQADLALMLDKKNLAIESMTEALQLQKKLVNLMDKHTDYNLLRFHQVNMQEAKGLLDAMGSFPDREELREEFTMIEQQFNTLVGA
ncbi:MAG: hypothetical protein KAH03_05960, partial [Cocleimonas sp.]|nr:hypothetical protein [Cocleimonas sp.]